MMNKKHFLSTLMITLLLSACGSDSTDSEVDKQLKTEAEISQDMQHNSAQQDPTKLVATPAVSQEQITGQKMADLKEQMKDEVSDWQRGRVQFLNLEGGFYGIITDSGKKILPMNMAKEFAQNGAIVRIKGKVKNVMTIQQWGTPFTITEIELIEPGSTGNEADK